MSSMQGSVRIGRQYGRVGIVSTVPYPLNKHVKNLDERQSILQIAPYRGQDVIVIMTVESVEPMGLQAVAYHHFSNEPLGSLGPGTYAYGKKARFTGLDAAREPITSWIISLPHPWEVLVEKTAKTPEIALTACTAVSYQTVAAWILGALCASLAPEAE